eukprot:935597-Alexandrium_andersonii.AAC.1
MELFKWSPVMEYAEPGSKRGHLQRVLKPHKPCPRAPSASMKPPTGRVPNKSALAAAHSPSRLGARWRTLRGDEKLW